MANAIGVKEWVIAEGYIPKESHGPSPQMTSHETVCILNCSDQDAHVEITIYYKDREPVGPYHVRCLRGALGMCDSMTLTIPSPSRATQITPASSAPMFPS